jgi:hypothetical protein
MDVFLGTLCKRGHEYGATGMSVRLRRGRWAGQCKECVDALHPSKVIDFVRQELLRYKKLIAGRVDSPVEGTKLTGPMCDAGHGGPLGNVYRKFGGVWMCMACNKAEIARRKLLSPEARADIKRQRQRANHRIGKRNEYHKARRQALREKRDEAQREHCGRTASPSDDGGQ